MLYYARLYYTILYSTLLYSTLLIALVESIIGTFFCPVPPGSLGVGYPPLGPAGNLQFDTLPCRKIAFDVREVATYPTRLGGPCYLLSNLVTLLMNQI